MSTKPVAAVHLEGTITLNADPDLLNFGDVKEGVRAKLEALHKTHIVLVMSPAVKYPLGAKRLWNFLIENDLSFSDVWCGDGLPSADVWVDDNAVKL
jgi:hypothetical protein